MAFVDANEPLPKGFKKSWRDMLERNVAIYRRLPEGLTRDLEALIPWFLDKVKFESAGDIKVNIEMKVCVAAEACLLIVRRSKKDYRYHRKVIITPRNLSTVGKDSSVAGDAGPSTVRLGWYWAQHGMEDGEDNYNIVIHEYVHVIDFSNDVQAESDLDLGSTERSREWKQFADEQYRRLVDLWNRKSRFKDPVIREYGASDIAEFITCASEAFFEVSRQLYVAEREIYDWLREIYGMDPAVWPERVSHEDLLGLRRREKELRRRREERRKRLDAAKRKCEEDINTLQQQIQQLERDGCQPQLDALAKEHEAAERKIQLNYKNKTLQLERRLRDASRKLERELAEAQTQHERALAKLVRELERNRQRLTKLEEQDAVDLDESIPEEELGGDEIVTRKSEHRTVSHFHPSGLPRLKYAVVRNLKDGLFMRWDEEGNLREEMHYSLGIRNGLCTYYYPSGPRELEGHYIKGERAGTWTGWNEDGSVKHESKYRQGRLAEWIRFLPDGTVESFKEPSKLDKAFGKR